MKRRRMLAILLVVLGLMVWPVEVSEAAPMGTAFTYQGRLIDANEAADGLYDFEFKLFDDPCTGTQQGGPIDVNDLDVIDGYFTAELDFGSDVFNGDARWLETTVSHADGSDPCTLRPRIEIAPVPYALHTRWFLVDAALGNVFAGEGAGASTTGYYNTAMGNNALYSNTTGYSNSAVGNRALYSNTTGSLNSAMGYRALYSNTTGYSNSAVGYYALNRNTTGNYNSAMGNYALWSNTTGYYNSAMGNLALYSNTVGAGNTAMGHQANLYNQEGSRNTMIGYEAGRGTSEHNKSGNVFIGYKAGYYETGDNKLYIANSDADPPLIYGDFSTGNVGIGTTTPSYQLEVKAPSHSALQLSTQSPNSHVDIRGIPTGGGNLRLNVAGGANAISFNVNNHEKVRMDSNGNVGIGTTSPAQKLDVAGNVTASRYYDRNNTGYYVDPAGTSYCNDMRANIFYDRGNITYYMDPANTGTSAKFAGAIQANGNVESFGDNGNLNARFSYLTGYPNNGYIAVKDAAGATQAGMYVDSSGNGRIYADSKSFRVANPDQPGTEIWYTCPEGPEAAAYVRGTGHLTNGKAEIILPDHFVAVASSQGITVQVTPLSAQSRGLAVVHKAPDRFVVQELAGGNGTYDFDYLVMAVRKGHEGYQVIRPALEAQAADAGEAAG